VEYAQKFGVWPYDPAKAKQLLAEAGYPNGFETTLWSAHNHSTAQKVIQFAQQQLAQVGVKAQILALEAGQRVERVESQPDPDKAQVRMYYVGWSSSTAEADWALRPLLASEAFPPKMFNMAYYKNDLVDTNIAKALNTTNKAEKEALYKAAQQQIWDDAPWVFLVTEQLLYARAKNLSGIYVMPDASYEYEEIDVK
jgi:glutathione transport system substrate-binding protein